MTTAATGSAIAGPVLDPDAIDRMHATVYELAADRYAGRRTGTPGGRAAADWLAAQLSLLGADVTVDDFAVNRAVRDLYQTPTLSRDGTDLVHRRDFAEHLATADAPDPVTGPLALPGAADLSGAWLLDATYASDRVTAAAQRGAVGVLLPRGTDEAGWMPKMIAGPPPAPLPILSVRNDLHQQMSLSVLRGPTTATGSVGLRTVDVNARNIYGRITPPAPGQAHVLLTAHYDGVGDDPQQRLPAAADNASGVAVILEVARHLARQPLPIGVIAGFLDAEEAGAHGSAHHAPQLAPGTLVINLDGAAALHQAAAVEAGGPAHTLLEALDRAARLTGLPLRAQAMPSDNRRYAAAGHAAIGIGMGLPGYQTPAETPDRLEPDTLKLAARLLLATIGELV